MSTRVLWDFLLDDAVITASSEASGYAKENVVADELGLFWRTTGCASEWIEFNKGADISEVAIFGHNLTIGATVKLYNGMASPANNLVGSFTWSAKNLLIFKDLIGMPPYPTWWRITFEDALNPDGYIEMGRIPSGAYFQPIQRFVVGGSRARVDPSLKNHSKGRDLYAFKEEKYSAWRLLFDQLDGSLSTDDQRQWETIFEDRGTTEPVVLSLDCSTMAEACRTTLYCLFERDYSDLWQSPVPTYQVPVEVAEII